MDEYQIKKIVVENSQCRYLLADHTKFGKFSLMTYTPLSAVEHVITDQNPPDDYLNFFNTHDINLHITTEELFK
jgi:DeoR family myo-inositol catabolism operon transcriptional repressor